MNFEAAALETFQILRSYDYDLKLFDEESNAVFEPEKARRFWAEKANLLVAILDNGEDSQVRLNLSKNTDINSVLGMTQALRTMATKYKMIFRVKTFSRKLSPKDFATQASVNEATNKQETERNTMNIVEGMYGTSRSSYLKLENARMIVRHSARINEESFGARGRNVDAVYIENNLGERHRFATNQLAPARAMAHHVDNGGSWADNVGAQISRMAVDFGNLGTASRHIGMYGGELVEAAHEARTTIREAMREMRRTFEGFGRKTRYGEICETLEAQAAEPLNEGEEDTARLAELAGMLNTSRVSLSESVIGSVARVLEAQDRRMKLSNERDMQTISVLGHPVNVEAWNLFKKGEIDFSHVPDLSKVPNFSNDGDRKLFILNEIVSSAKDDSLVNLFNAVLDGLPSARGATRNGYMQIALQMLKCVEAPAAPEKVAAGSAAVAEHLTWMKGFGRPETLVEYDRFEQPDDREWDHAEGVLHDLVNGFDYHEFMASPAGDEFNYTMLDRLDDEERTVEYPRLVAAIESYLDHALERSNASGMHTHSDAEHLAKGVADAMGKDGYIVTGAPGAEAGEEHGLLAAEGLDEFDADLDGEIDENCGDCPADRGLDGTAGLMDEDAFDECELQQEDVLLPKAENTDFIRDVTVKKVTDPDSGEEKDPDTSYIDRLRALAGMGSGQH